MEISTQTELPKKKTKIYTLNAVKAYYKRMKQDDEKYRKHLAYMKEYMKKRYQQKKNDKKIENI